jgi:hypothetical protein
MTHENCIYVDHDAYAEVHRARVVKARKEHRCDECGETIKARDLYENATGLWEGIWETYKTCARCVLVRSDFFRGWLYGNLVADFQEAFGFDYRDGIPPDFAPCGRKGEE